MTSTTLYPIVLVFRYTSQPFTPLTWFGLNISTLDVLGLCRLCLLLRQIRDQLHLAHVFVHGPKDVERPSFVKNLTATMTVMFGGEALVAPLLGLPPSFMLSGDGTILASLIQATIDHLPTVPQISAVLELPFAILDAFTRAFMLCNLVPPLVISHASPDIATSPWTLLVSSLIIANGGFILTNMFSLLHPTSWTVKTPQEFQAYGWTSVDLWCAPTITGIYALLTHAQPFWSDLHKSILDLLGTSLSTSPKSVSEPLDPETARAACTLLLAALFLQRAFKTYGVFKTTQTTNDTGLRRHNRSKVNGSLKEKRPKLE